MIINIRLVTSCYESYETINATLIWPYRGHSCTDKSGKEPTYPRYELGFLM